MPTYEYKCPKCGTEFQLVQKMSAKPGAKCPKCGSRAERQMSGGAGLVFKGSGFYLTDYGRAGQTPRKESGDVPAASPSDKPADKPSAEPAAPAPKAKPAKKKDD